MLNIIVGIDLATKTTGFCINILDQSTSYGFIDKSILGIVENDGFSIEKIQDYYFNFVKEIIKRVEGYTTLKSYEEYTIKVGIEISNIKSPLLAMKFNFLGGMIVGIFLRNFNKVEFKTFNANEWFQFLAQDLKINNWTHLERQERKKITMDWVSNLLNYKIDSDDKADAFAIAYFYDKCKDTINRHNFTQKNRMHFKNKILTKTKQIQNYNKEINKYLNEINEIKMKGQVSKIQERTKKKLEHLEQKLQATIINKKVLQNEKKENK